MTIILARNCIEKTHELNISQNFFKGRLLSHAMSVIVVPTEFVALIGKVVRFVFVDSIGKFCLLTLRYCDKDEHRFKRLDDRLNPENTARKIRALLVGLPSSVLFSWSVPELNYSIHQKYGLTRRSKPKAITASCENAYEGGPSLEGRTTDRLTSRSTGSTDSNRSPQSAVRFIEEYSPNPRGVSPSPSSEPRHITPEPSVVVSIPLDKLMSAAAQQGPGRKKETTTDTCDSDDDDGDGYVMTGFGLHTSGIETS